MDESTGRGTSRGEITKLKVFEEMLTYDPGSPSRKQPQQAVVENQLNEEALDETNHSILDRNRALIQYAATIGISNSNTDEFNYEFVETLVKGGADINVADQYGQTIFHEVARSWNTDVAKFLLDIGCDINKRDSFGRTPLHVAAAVDFPDMTKFLLDQNADIDARTFVEEQAPIHYAAKNGAERSLKMLLGFQADIDSKDGKQRTALQLAAEWTRTETAKLLLDEGASSCLLDSCGNSALCVLIDQIPNLALDALSQLHTSDEITLREFYYLQYLDIRQPETKIRTPLEVAVATRKFEVVTHPVMQRLIRNKWKQYGRFSTMVDILFHVVYSILWTVGCIGIPKTGEEIWNKPRIWSKILVSLISLMTLYDVAVQIKTTVNSRMSQRDWVTWRISQLEDDMKYCHPQWPQEQQYVKGEIKRVKSMPLLNNLGSWFYIEWIILILIIGAAIMYIVYSLVDNNTSRYIYTRTVSVLNLLVWLRLLKYVRPLNGIGTLVIILGETSADFINWAFLYILILLPFTAAFWINFGGLTTDPVHDYDEVQKLVHIVFRLAVGDEYNLEGLLKVDPVMARILIVLYVISMTIVTLNLLIALLADTFSRVHSNAVANTIMQRARKVVSAEQMLRNKVRRKYDEHMRMNCSPEILKVIANEGSLIRPDKVVEKNELQEQVRCINKTLSDRFGKSYGSSKISDFDAIYQDIKKILKHQEQLSSDLVEIAKLLKIYADNYEKKYRRRQQRENAHEPVQEQQSFISALQETAASLIQRFVSNNPKDEKDRSRRNKNPEEGSRERSRGRRKRRQRKEELDGEIASGKIRDKKGIKRKPKNTEGTNAVTLYFDNQLGRWISSDQNQPNHTDNISIDS